MHELLWTRSGALVAADTQGVATTARASIEGHEARLVLAAEGPLATPAMLSGEQAFLGLRSLAAIDSLRPAMAIPGVSAAAIVITQGRAFTAEVGAGRCYVQGRDGRLEACASGRALTWGDQVVAASAALELGEDFFRTGPAARLGEASIRALAAQGHFEVGAQTFHDGSLDDALRVALQALSRGCAVGASRVGFIDARDAQSYRGTLTEGVLAAVDAVCDDGGLSLLLRRVETDDDYAGLPTLMKEIHAVVFADQGVRRRGLDGFIDAFGAARGTLAQVRDALERVGAADHAAALRAAAARARARLPAEVVRALELEALAPARVTEWEALPSAKARAIAWLRAHRADVARELAR
ncbi:MAG: hypothetical protein R3B09_13485 [Nannocystaceae bacterium]